MLLTIPPPPPGGYQGLIFDCDGTLADSMPIHFEAWNSALAKWGCRLSKELFYRWAGTPTDGIVRKLNDLFHLEMRADEVSHEKENLFLEKLSEVQGIQSVLDQVEFYRGKLPMAVASGGNRETVLRTLEALQIRDRFSAVVAAEDCSRGKPDPELFLLAARKLDVSPASCLVFEDAELGIEAAISAGMHWVRVPVIH